MAAAGGADRWFAEWFNDDYLALYAHRNDREARSIVDLIHARLPSRSHGRTLDLGCGAGRHLPYLGESQPTIGLDLSPWLLDVARRRHPDTPLVRADMRSVPFLDASFTLVVSLFTSFGYFADDEQNRHVVREIARVTAAGGWLVLDFLNAPQTRRTIIPFERTSVGRMAVDQRREISADGRFVTKTIRINAGERIFRERVRLFEPADLVSMLRDGGFAVSGVCGDYAGSPVTSTSPRAIVLARRN